MGTDDFRSISVTYGLDSQSFANCFKAFSSYLDVPEKEWNKYHPTYKDVISSAPARPIEVCIVDHIVPEPYIEKIPFPAKVKEHSILANMVSKSTKKIVELDEQIIIEPTVAIVKDLVTENLEDGHIVFCEDASNDV